MSQVDSHMEDEPPHAYDDFYACPHDCGWVGEKLKVERVKKFDSKADWFRCPRCERLMAIDDQAE